MLHQARCSVPSPDPVKGRAKRIPRWLIQTGHFYAVHIPVHQAGLPASDLLWLPLTHTRAMDWVVLLDKRTGQPRAYAHIDGFIEKQ